VRRQSLFEEMPSTVLLSDNFFVPRQEIRNPKLEIRNQSKFPNLKHKLVLFRTLEFGILNLFRISNFDFRILLLCFRLCRGSDPLAATSPKTQRRFKIRMM